MFIVFLLDKLVHALAHLNDKRLARRKATTISDGGGAAAGASTANLLSHEDQRAAAPAQQGCMRRLRRPGKAATGADVEAAGSAAASPRAQQHGAPAAPASVDGDGDGSADACAGSESGASLAELSAPMPPLTEPCDELTSTVVAASCPDTAAGAEVRTLRWPPAPLCCRCR